MTDHRPVYLVDGARTPFIKARGHPGPFSPVDLAVQCGRPLLLRQPFSADAFDQVILGCVNVVVDEMNPARIAAIRLGMGRAMPAFTVQINCGSGMQAIDTAFRYVRSGHAELILAGGTDALSHTPLVLRREAADWFQRLATAKSNRERLRLVGDFRPSFAVPLVGLERGLVDPIVELDMGQTAEKLAHLFGIDREAADRYAVDSQLRLARAQEEDRFAGEIEAMIAPDGRLFDHDDGVRADTSLAKLAELKPAFEKPYGKVTPGNASQVTDGAALTVVASEAAVERHGLTPLARIVDSEWSALDPAIMGLGPTLAATALLRRRGLGRDDVALWEINEAFAAQVLACLEAWQNADYGRDVLGLDGAFGAVPRADLNVDGGAIGIGHPVGASGARITLHLANAMGRLGKARGLATECIGGGQGGAVLLEAA
jgi:acetyl-CoA C-acetyltransferase